MLVTSRPYSVAASAYLGRIAAALFWQLWWLPLIPLAAVAAGLWADTRIALIGLMMLFIIYPAVMTLALIRYGMSPAVAARARATSMTLDDTSLTLLRGNSAAPVIISTAGITGVRIVSGDRLVIHTGPRPDDIVIVPADALTPADIAAVTDRFSPEWQD